MILCEELVDWLEGPHRTLFSIFPFPNFVACNSENVIDNWGCTTLAKSMMGAQFFHHREPSIYAFCHSSGFFVNQVTSTTDV